jgi:hypothetical protein
MSALLHFIDTAQHTPKQHRVTALIYVVAALFNLGAGPGARHQHGSATRAPAGGFLAASSCVARQAGTISLVTTLFWRGRLPAVHRSEVG